MSKPNPPTGARAHPAPPMPSQHLQKPGDEGAMALPPQYQAPDYQGSDKLAGMAAIVTGGDSGIGRAVSVLFAREGADVAIVYLNEHEDARETERAVRAEGRRCLLIAGDVRDSAFCGQGRGSGGAGVWPTRRAGEQRRVPGSRRWPAGHQR